MSPMDGMEYGGGVSSLCGKESGRAAIRVAHLPGLRLDSGGPRYLRNPRMPLSSSLHFPALLSPPSPPPIGDCSPVSPSTAPTAAPTPSPPPTRTPSPAATRSHPAASSPPPAAWRRPRGGSRARRVARRTRPAASTAPPLHQAGGILRRPASPRLNTQRRLQRRRRRRRRPQSPPPSEWPAGAAGGVLLLVERRRSRRARRRCRRRRRSAAPRSGCGARLRAEATSAAAPVLARPQQTEPSNLPVAAAPPPLQPQWPRP
jgi:hypothetical protein